jgi:hypothetical protein
MLLISKMPAPAPPRPPLFGLLFISLFGFIGVTVLWSLWFGDDGFGGPPLVFKLVGSFIAIAFILMGFGLPLAALRQSRQGGGAASAGNQGETPTHPAYDCPNCGANVQDADVSPSGDVKCPYCKGWWNIHRSG